MTDRLTEIEARLETAPIAFSVLNETLTCGKEAAEFIAHSPGDIKWLVEEVKRLRGELDSAEAGKKYYMRAAERGGDMR